MNLGARAHAVEKELREEADFDQYIKGMTGDK